MESSIVFNSIADLKDFDVTYVEERTVATVKEHTVGTGYGGGTFVLKNSDVNANGGTIVAAETTGSGPSRAWFRIFDGMAKAEHFGAVPNNEQVDNAPMVNACLNAHQECALGAGNYYARDMIKIGRFQEVAGRGKSRTTWTIQDNALAEEGYAPPASLRGQASFTKDRDTVGLSGDLSFSTGDGVIFTSTQLPAGISSGERLYVTDTPSNTQIKVAKTRGGKAITFGSAASGVTVVNTYPPDATSIKLTVTERFVAVRSKAWWDRDNDGIIVRDFSIDLNGNGQKKYGGDKVCLTAVMLTGNRCLIENIDAQGHRAGVNAECFCVWIAPQRDEGDPHSGKVGDIVACSVHDPATSPDMGGNPVPEITSILLGGNPKSDGTYVGGGTIRDCHVYNLPRNDSQESACMGITFSGYGITIINNTVSDVDGSAIWLNAYNRCGDILISNNNLRNVAKGFQINLTSPLIHWERIVATQNVISLARGGVPESESLCGLSVYCNASKSAAVRKPCSFVAGDPWIESGISGLKKRQMVNFQGNTPGNMPPGEYFVVEDGTPKIQVSNVMNGPALVPDSSATGGTCTQVDGYLDGLLFERNIISSEDASAVGIAYSLNRGVFGFPGGNGAHRNFIARDNIITLPDGAVSLSRSLNHNHTYGQLVFQNNKDIHGNFLRVRYHHRGKNETIDDVQDEVDAVLEIDETFAGIAPNFASGWTFEESHPGTSTVTNTNIAPVTGADELYGVVNISVPDPADPGFEHVWLHVPGATVTPTADGEFDYVLDLTFKPDAWGTTTKDYRMWAGLLADPSPADTLGEPPVTNFIGVYCGGNASHGSIKGSTSSLSSKLGSGTAWITLRMVVRSDLSQVSYSNITPGSSALELLADGVGGLNIPSGVRFNIGVLFSNHSDSNTTANLWIDSFRFRKIKTRS